MHRRAVHRGKSRGDLHGADGVGRLHRPHRNDERAVERSRRHRLDRRAVHRHGAIAGHVAKLDAVFEQRLLERERAADGEGDEIVAPVFEDVARLVDERAVAPDAIARQVGADVEIVGQSRNARIARRRDADQRARLRIALAELQKILRQGLRQDREIGLHEARRQPRGRAGMRIAPDRQPRRATGGKRLGIFPLHRRRCHRTLLFNLAAKLLPTLSSSRHAEKAGPAATMLRAAARRRAGMRAREFG